MLSSKFKWLIIILLFQIFNFPQIISSSAGEKYQDPQVVYTSIRNGVFEHSQFERIVTNILLKGLYFQNNHKMPVQTEGNQINIPRDNKQMIKELESYIESFDVASFEGDEILEQYSERLNNFTVYKLPGGSTKKGRIIYQHNANDRKKNVVVLEIHQSQISRNQANENEIFVGLRRKQKDSNQYYVFYIYLRNAGPNDKNIKVVDGKSKVIQFDSWDDREAALDRVTETNNDEMYYGWSTCTTTILIPCKTRQIIMPPPGTAMERKSDVKKPTALRKFHLSTQGEIEIHSQIIKDHFETEDGFISDANLLFFQDLDDETKQQGKFIGAEVNLLTGLTGAVTGVVGGLGQVLASLVGGVGSTLGGLLGGILGSAGGPNAPGGINLAGLLNVGPGGLLNVGVNLAGSFGGAAGGAGGAGAGQGQGGLGNILNLGVNLAGKMGSMAGGMAGGQQGAGGLPGGQAGAGGAGQGPAGGFFNLLNVGANLGGGFFGGLTGGAQGQGQPQGQGGLGGLLNVGLNLGQTGSQAGGGVLGGLLGVTGGLVGGLLGGATKLISTVTGTLGGLGANLLGTVVKAGVGVVNSVAGFGGLGTPNAKPADIGNSVGISGLLALEGGMSTQEKEEFEDELQNNASGGLGGLLEIDVDLALDEEEEEENEKKDEKEVGQSLEDDDSPTLEGGTEDDDDDEEGEEEDEERRRRKKRSPMFGSVAALRDLLAIAGVAVNADALTKPEFTYVQRGWKIAGPMKAQESLAYESEPFVGFGICPHKKVTQDDWNNIKTGEDTIHFMASVLKTYCIKNEIKFYGQLLATGILTFDHSTKSLKAVENHSLLKHKKLGKKNGAWLARAFELSLLTEAYRSEMMTNAGTIHKSCGCPAHISRRVYTLGQSVLKGLDALKSTFLQHRVHLLRSLATTVKTAFLKLVQDQETMENYCTGDCKEDSIKNYNDQLHLMSIMQLILHGLDPIYNGTEDAESALEAFQAKNSGLIAKKVDAYYG